MHKNFFFFLISKKCQNKFSLDYLFHKTHSGVYFLEISKKKCTFYCTDISYSVIIVSILQYILSKSDSDNLLDY